jgi:aminoglycoside 3-N-acetyltransferase I
MARVFEEPQEELGATHLQRLLTREDFWVLAAFAEHELAGGLTAHTLPMTRKEASEIFIYDLAVHTAHQRRGVGRRLMDELGKQASAAGIKVLFVPADNEDTHALDFYHAVGGEPAPVTIFTFERT